MRHDELKNFIANEHPELTYKEYYRIYTYAYFIGENKVIAVDNGWIKFYVPDNSKTLGLRWMTKCGTSFVFDAFSVEIANTERLGKTIAEQAAYIKKMYNIARNRLIDDI